jgi:L-lactate utilization protein LutC
MAHKVAGIAQSYSSHDCIELLSKYESALPWLIPETISQVKSELEETKTEYEDKIEKLETEFGEKLMLQGKTLMQYIGEALKKQGIKTSIEIEGEEDEQRLT